MPVIKRLAPFASLILLLALALPAPAQTTQSLNPNQMTGTWLFRDQTEELVLVLNQDGTYSTRYTTAQGVEQYSGTWQFNGTHMTFASQGEPPESYLAGLQDANTLVVTFSAVQDPNATTVYMQRVDGPQAATGQPQPQPQPQITPQVQPQPQPQVRPKHQGQTPAQPQPVQANPALGALPQTMNFVRYTDATERAFTVLMPEGWKVKGGVIRVDPTKAGGPANSLEAKVDFSVHSDQQSTMAAYILPKYYFTTLAGSTVQSMYPEGSAYYGMEVVHVMDPVEFAVKKAFPYAHPNASQPQVTLQRDMPQLAQLYRDAGGPLAGNFNYQAAVVELQYQEGGRAYHERMLIVIEDRGQIAGGQWCNPLTLVVRAPVGQLDAWEPVFRIIGDSFEFEKQWMAAELKAQLEAAKFVGDVEAEIHRIDAEITAHRQKTNAEIADQMFMNLTGQEYYVDPETNKVVQGSNAWQHVLKGPDGAMTYTNDPEVAQQLQQQQDYKTYQVYQPKPVQY